LATPRDMTITRMTVTALRIQGFVARHGRMPSSLSELPAEPNKDCETTDGWGRPLRWSYDAANAKFTIWSLGRDGKEGGTGDDEDIYLTNDIKPDFRSSPPAPRSSR